MGEQLTLVLLNGLVYGLLLFMLSSGLTLIFGMMGVLNLSHASFYMLGAYLAYSLTPLVDTYLGGGFFTTIALGVVLAVAFGYLLEWLFFSYLFEREHLQDADLPADGRDAGVEARRPVQVRLTNR